MDSHKPCREMSCYTTTVIDNILGFGSTGRAAPHGLLSFRILNVEHWCFKGERFPARENQYSSRLKGLLKVVPLREILTKNSATIVNKNTTNNDLFIAENNKNYLLRVCAGYKVLSLLVLINLWYLGTTIPLGISKVITLISYEDTCPTCIMIKENTIKTVPMAPNTLRRRFFIPSWKHVKRHSTLNNSLRGSVITLPQVNQRLPNYPHPGVLLKLSSKEQHVSQLKKGCITLFLLKVFFCPNVHIGHETFCC